jgi:hypothetical protein
MRHRIALAGISLFLGCLVLADDAKNEPFRFGEDRGGKLLSQLLPPNGARVRDHFEKQSTKGPAAIERPSLPSTTISATVPRLAADRSRRDLQPGAVPEDTPLSQYRGTPPVPREPKFYVAERVRVPSADVNVPIQLPILARPVSERASVDDATLDASMAASIAATMPMRILAAPYVRFTIPNPFEFRDAVQSKTTLEEDPMPLTTSPKLPR